ncbi:MAG TPA: AraC family transcriptional regulator [Ramlibacter sp.]|nr:AraC family transcriptional regulator [Ramlibacter sp.]
MQHRTTLAAGPALRVERVVSLAPRGAWSCAYLAPGARVLLPGSDTVELRRGGGNLLADPLTAVALEAGEPDTLGRWAPPESDTFVVSAAGNGAAPMPAGGAWLLPPHLLYMLRCHWASLGRGRVGASTPSVMRAVFRDARPAPVDEAPPVRRARRLLATGAGPALSLHDVADAACTTPFHLARLFRRETGSTLHQYRHALRIAAALGHLARGERDLAGLAHELGYCSQSHFGAMFRKLLSVTPSQARAALAA